MTIERSGKFDALLLMSKVPVTLVAAVGVQVNPTTKYWSNGTLTGGATTVPASSVETPTPGLRVMAGSPL